MIRYVTRHVKFQGDYRAAFTYVRDSSVAFCNRMDVDRWER